MGISSNQARFLALTSRQIDLEHRIQQICQRRLRLTSELENVSTSYNNNISNRKLYAMNTTNSGITSLTVDAITKLKDTSGKAYSLIGKDGSTFYQLDSSAATLTGGTNDASVLNSTALASVSNTTTGVLKLGGTSYTFADLGLKVGAKEEDVVEAALRANIISVGQVKDEFSQTYTPVTNAGTVVADQYEVKDWRALPSIADELYKGDDVDAENKYDKTIDEINTQDKKLQLEQTSIEVEYKAVTSEKESVKKILDTNAQASFKYFS